MKTIRVEVTAEDIAHGHQCDCTDCPVARAINRLLAESVYVAADQNIIKFYASSTTMCIGSAWTPDPVADFICAFDCHDIDQIPRPTPFSFDLEIPDDIPLREAA